MIYGEVKVGDIFAWDVDGILSSCYIGTKTVEILEIKERGCYRDLFTGASYELNPLATVVGEIWMFI